MKITPEVPYQRAERWYSSYTDGTRQFEGTFRIRSQVGAYAIASGKGPVTIEWSGIKFWRK